MKMEKRWTGIFSECTQQIPEVLLKLMIADQKQET